MKKTIVAFVAAPALLLSACGSANQSMSEGDYDNVRADDNYVAVCVDKEGNRVDDSECASAPEYRQDNGIGISDIFWGYLIANALMPSYGSRVTGYSTYVDQTRHNVYRGGVPRSGGYVDYRSYKPLTSKVVKPAAAVNSPAYNYNYNKSPNYTRPVTKPSVKSSVKNGTGYQKKSGGGSGGYKAPAPRRK
jgi:hypothetical protein